MREKAGSDEHDVAQKEMKMQTPKPSPLIASVHPDKAFDRERHVTFGNVFMEHSMEPLEDEINAITQRVGMPDRADQGWISLVGAEVSEISWRLFSLAGGPLSPGSGNCRIKAGTMVIPGCTIDLYAGQGDVHIGLSRVAVPNALSWLQSSI